MLHNKPYWDALEAMLTEMHPNVPRDELLPWEAWERKRGEERKRSREKAMGGDGSSSTAAPAAPSVPPVAEDADYSESEAAGVDSEEDFAGGPSGSSGGTGGTGSTIMPLPDLSRNGWVSRKKQMWECQSVDAKAAPAMNLFLADELDKLATHYGSVGGDQWRSFANSKAAKKLRGLEWEVTEAKELKSIKGFGDKTIAKVAELMKTGSLRRLDMLQSTDRSQALAELSKVHGVGPKTAQEWFLKGITSIEQAQNTPGLMSHTQRVGARFWRDLEERIPRAEVTAIVDAVRAAMRAALASRGVPAHALEGAADATAAGSYRRGKPSSGDVDVLLCRRDGGADSGLIEDVLKHMEKAGVAVHHLTHEEEVQRGGTSGFERVTSCSSYRGIIQLPGYALHRRLDLKLYPPEEFAYALLYFTGSDHFNRSMRHYAKSLGYSLSDHGIVHAIKMAGTKDNCVRGTMNLFEAKTEEEIFAKLGLEYVEPTQRNTDIIPLGEQPARLK